jgi:hypothetical protein
MLQTILFFGLTAFEAKVAICVFFTENCNFHDRGGGLKPSPNSAGLDQHVF